MRVLAALLVIALLASNSLIILAEPPGTAERSALGDRPMRTIVMKFRSECCYWDNGTYSIWEANTTELPDTWISHEFSCTARNRYDDDVVYTGGIAWVSDPLLADFYVEGDVIIRVWLSSQSPLVPVGIMASVAEVDDEGNIYASWNSTIMIDNIPYEPKEYEFVVHVPGHTFPAGRRIGFSVEVGVEEVQGYTATAWFGGGPYPASARVPTNSYLDITGVSIYYEGEGANRTKFYIDESPICFEVEVSDPLSNLDVAEVRVVVRNDTHTVFDGEAEAITDRSAYKTHYLAVWELDGVSAGDYVAEVRAVDNSGIEVARSYELKIVELKIVDWSYTPDELMRGLEEAQELRISFSNGGNDIMYAVQVQLADPAGLEVEPMSCSVGDLGPGEACSLSFSVQVPPDAELGPRQLLFVIAYEDFRGVGHEEQRTADIEIVRLAVNLTLSLEPGEARLLDNITAYVELRDLYGQPLAGQEVRLSVDGAPLVVLITNETGRASFTFTATPGLGPGQHIIAAYFNGTDLYEAEEARATLTLRLREAVLEILSAPAEVEAGQEAEVEALLRDEDGWPIGNASLALYVREEGWVLLAEGRTDENGRITLSFVLEREGEHELRLVFRGTEVHEGAEAIFTVVCTRAGGWQPWPGQGGEQPDVITFAVAGLACFVLALPFAIWFKKRREL